MPFWVLFDYILQRESLNSVNLQEARVDLTPCAQRPHELELETQGLMSEVVEI